MVSYASAHSGYTFTGYGSASSSYSVTTTNWKKTTCCGAFRAAQRCTDCPGN